MCATSHGVSQAIVIPERLAEDANTLVTIGRGIHTTCHRMHDLPVCDALCCESGAGHLSKGAKAREGCGECLVLESDSCWGQRLVVNMQCDNSLHDTVEIAVGLSIVTTLNTLLLLALFLEDSNKTLFIRGKSVVCGVLQSRLNEFGNRSLHKIETLNKPFHSVPTPKGTIPGPRKDNLGFDLLNIISNVNEGGPSLGEMINLKFTVITLVTPRIPHVQPKDNKSASLVIITGKLDNGFSSFG